MSKQARGRGHSGGAVVRRPTYCSVGHLTGSSSFDADLASLLRTRLRLVTLLAFVPTALFFGIDWFDAFQPTLAGPVARALHLCVVALTGTLAAVVWLGGPLRLCSLRRIELLLFGLLGGFFGWMQFNTFSNLEMFSSAGCVVETHHRIELVRNWIDGSATRWFFLIVCYGVFIPNTWRRCAVVVGMLAVAPLLLTPMGSLWWRGCACPSVLFSLADLAIVMGTASAIAVFGSHRLQSLRREALAARRLGQYHLGLKIGAGGMGEVYKAEHVLLRRACAIKLIRPDAEARQGDVLERFEREVKAMATLTHPNTVEVFDYGQAGDGTFYYVMEYLPGMNLETLVAKHGPMPAERAVHFLRQMCRALREAHSIGLLHRDIKPSNIIAAERGGEYDIGKLLDFGLVQDLGLGASADRLTVEGAVLGSPPFMSPEQAAGRNDIDARADIYSLGGVGYFLLTGRLPFPRETPMEMLLAHAYEAPVPPREVRANVPGDVEAVILRCLRKRPEERYANVTEVERALARCAAADGWDQEQAREWWMALPREEETAPVIAAMATPHG